jgi:hypothetical protein
MTARLCWRSARRNTASSWYLRQRWRVVTRSGRSLHRPLSGKAGSQIHRSDGHRNMPSARHACSLRMSTTSCWWIGMPAGFACRLNHGASRPAFLKRFDIPNWESLTRGEASDILDHEFAALDKERKRRQAEKVEQTASRKRSGRDVA